MARLQFFMPIFLPPPNSTDAAYMTLNPQNFIPVVILGYNFALNADPTQAWSMLRFFQKAKHGGHSLYHNASGDEGGKEIQEIITEGTVVKKLKQKQMGKEKRKEVNEIKGDPQIASDVEQY